MNTQNGSRLRRRILIFGAAALIVSAAVTIPAEGFRPFSPEAQAEEKISRLGEYRGYSSPAYDSWVRESVYIPMRDGVKIALDIFHPAQNGKAAEEKLPVVWDLRRYLRASIRNGKAVGLFVQRGPYMTALLKQGYVLVSADSRGTGASFGIWEGPWSETEARDAYDVTEWLAAQPWSNGRIGMVGSSYEGTNQLMAAAMKPPHLKAIMPAMAMFDIYDLVYPGGIFRKDLVDSWTLFTKEIDLMRVPAPVDADLDGKLVQEARLLHSKNRLAGDIIAPLKFRDDVDPQSGRMIFRDWQPAGHIKEIRDSGAAIYLLCGWYDIYIRDGFQMFKNLGPRFKMTVMDCSHSPEDPSIVPEAVKILTSEQLRWFDYWLKGIDNGVAAEPPIQYQTRIEGSERIWRSSDRWPLPETKVQSYFFNAGSSGSIASVNDGKLAADIPREKQGRDSYTVNFTTTSGLSTRWDNGVSGNFDYPDMVFNDAKALTYTTEPLAEDIEVTGHPVLHLWIDSTAVDGDFIVYLEEVDAKGFSRYVSEGCLRASHRVLSGSPYDDLGLPYHGSLRAEAVPLTPGQPAELVFDLLPVSNVFNAGNRIRIAVVCADRDNLETTAVDPAPQIGLYRNSKFASRLDLPVVIRKAAK